MWTRATSFSIFLLLLSCLRHGLSTSHLEPSEDELGTHGEKVAEQAEGKRSPSTVSSLDGIPSSLSESGVKIDPDSSAGLKDAPFDGKDGRPHTGPFIETSADRNRKKAKESGEEDTTLSGKRPSKPSGKDLDLPTTNDGVMDDPHRPGPKEGTRGTEGGVSEKNREKEGSLSGSGPEKVPDPPKEAPPLPHSEQEKLGPKDPSKKAGDGVFEDDGKPKELGGLEV